MDIIKWRSSYETSIPSMDEQHRKLIDLINTMYRVMRKDEGPEQIDTVLKEMSEYASGHLRDEEALLQENGYTDFDSHLALHKEYLTKMEELRKEWDKDKTSGGTKYLYFSPPVVARAYSRRRSEIWSFLNRKRREVKQVETMK